jgi:hypothetical protein
VAAILFVSPAHVRLLLERGELRVAKEIDADDVGIDIDATSFAHYQPKLEEAWCEYLASQNERDPTR